MQQDSSATFENDVARIKVRIESLIKEHFNNGLGNLFLSRLGGQLGSDRVLLERLTGQRLGEFVRQNFNYEIGKGGQKNNVLFLVAPDMPGTTNAPPPRPMQRYAPPFWAAFAIPLKENEQRYINLATLRFGPDRASLGAENDDIRVISPEYIALPNASGSPNETVARIEAWLGAEHLDGERFLAKRPRLDGHGSVLDALLQSLSTEELRRISLPLDIIKILSTRKS